MIISTLEAFEIGVAVGFTGALIVGYLLWRVVNEDSK